jgi:hypothetical protein
MNRGAPYNAAGRFIKLTEKGKKAVSAFLDKIRGNEGDWINDSRH